MNETAKTEAPVDTGGVGARVRRREDERHLHGKGRFVADYAFPDLQDVAFLRSPVAHAVIRQIGKPERFADRVIVREDMVGATDIVADSSLPSYKSSAHPPLAAQKVRFVGEPVAMCFAGTRAEAEDIAEEIELDLGELPAFANAFTARERTDTRVHEHWPDNLFLDMQADVDFDVHAQRASVVVTQKVDLARQCMVPMEGKAVLAYWDHPQAQLVVITSTQVPHMIRTILAQCLGLDQAQVRVISPDVGGAFGYKCVLQQEELCIAWLALTYKRPFRFIEDRREHLIAGANTRQHHYELTAYADDRGRLLALDAQLLIDGGAYSAWPFTIGLETGQALGNLPGPYDFRGYRCRTQCAATNKPGFLPYRGVARTGVCFAIELTMDAIAHAVGREAWEVRHDNLVRGADMPYTNVVKKHYDSGDFQESLRRAVEQIDVPRWRQRQAQGEADGRLVGVGFATFTEQSAHGTSVFASWGLPVVPGYDLATVRITADGGIELRAGIHSHGQGMETTLAQIASEVLGVSVQKIKLVHGDTALTPYSTGTYASRSIVMAGGAVAAACRELIPRLIRIGAHLLNEAESAVRFDAGRVVGASGCVTLADVAAAWYMRPDLLPKGVDLAGLETTQGFKPAVDTGAFSYATHAAVVAVDTQTGQVDILDYVIVEDCGTMINPMVVEGQTIGGTAQGIGTAFYEETLYDDNAQPLTSTLADYMLPGPTELPSLRIHHMETPSPYTEFGAKGVGEGGAIAPPAALFNAVNDALRPLGARVSETPLTPRRLLQAIEAAKAARASGEQPVGATEEAIR
ncbi:xanthine dehydrogenase family protein molybdopterin-binding subunit [Burkholderia sp. Bp9017]|uniref:Xanthine dehydrogenase family protein n=1 Tax=Burkholderia anthina TaxID=179879 RepID=A0A7T7AJ84_9BURK|nr:MULTISPECIES: xanthine dehydrogenase family protein molybdopterin-binding subunit [Burkholderia]MBY4868271.1 xanthine dehydrogenase family protein molybdopterin-binding subunit [Burkholderia anthina]QQK04635.1 xanthine dehydrogenase family protein [Burkholderia anthina]RQZ21950.1 xanthine dehydrogenase family protein molybdopterin-binding subunit [Burkholderia sp. Bp9017]RQZ30328.1 xanthine dehydrogenase family protein molybdopterin-binding subunit [Burkholderia sp. Bp9016]